MKFVLPRADDWLERLGLVVTWADPHGFHESIQPPVLLLRKRNSPREQRWYTFHAIAHCELHSGNQLWLERNGRQQLARKWEQQAERWTADLLVPADELQQMFAAGNDAEQLAEAFDVPLDGLQVALQRHRERAEVAAALENDAQELADVAFHFEPRPWPHCAYCDDWAQDVYQTRAAGQAMPQGWLMRTPLCAKHEQLLFDAGDQGRVYAGDGVRYWLLER